MTEEIAKVEEQKKPQNALEALSSRLQVSTEVLTNTLKSTAFKECKTNEEFVSAVIVANTYGLNPILKQMYVFPSRGGIIPIVSIDGWIELVKRRPDFNGVELIENEAEKGELMKEKENAPFPGGLKSVTAKFYIKGKDYPVIITEYMNECYQPNKEPWKNWPRRMLRHKAYIQGARIAFGLSGIYDEDEGERIKYAEVVEESHMKPVVEMPKALPKGEQASPQESKDLLDIDNTTTFYADIEDKNRKLLPKEKSAIFIIAKKHNVPEPLLRDMMLKNFSKKSTGELTVGEAIEIYEWMNDYKNITEKENG